MDKCFSLVRMLVWYMPPYAAWVGHGLSRYNPEPASDRPYESVSVNGDRINCDLEDWGQYFFAMHGYRSWRNCAIAKYLCKPGDTVVEAGANVGTDTVFLSRIVGKTGKVFAFEPLPSNFNHLKHVLYVNRLDNVTAQQQALGDEPGFVQFVVPPRTNIGTGHLATDTGDNKTQRIEVPVIKLDAIQDEIGPVKFIWLDVEGYEIYILDGAKELIAEQRPYIILEASATLTKQVGHNLPKLVESIAALQYKPYAIFRFGLGDVQKHINKRLVNNPSSDCDWLCIPNATANHNLIVHEISTFVRRVGFLPMIHGINPLASM